MPDINTVWMGYKIVAWLYLCGTFLGVTSFLLVMQRRGFGSTIAYWNDPADFSGPAECFGSIGAAHENMLNPSSLSVPKIIFGLVHGILASALFGLVILGFVLIMVYMTLQSIF